jgi:hypothetical protein
MDRTPHRCHATPHTSHLDASFFLHISPSSPHPFPPLPLPLPPSSQITAVTLHNHPPAPIRSSVTNSRRHKSAPPRAVSQTSRTMHGVSSPARYLVFRWTQTLYIVILGYVPVRSLSPFVLDHLTSPHFSCLIQSALRPTLRPTRPLSRFLLQLVRPLSHIDIPLFSRILSDHRTSSVPDTAYIVAIM